LYGARKVLKSNAKKKGAKYRRNRGMIIGKLRKAKIPREHKTSEWKMKRPIGVSPPSKKGNRTKKIRKKSQGKCL
jgi:hypothetical protein